MRTSLKDNTGTSCCGSAQTGWLKLYSLTCGLRLRCALWRQWKTARRRRAALIGLGVRSVLASNTTGSGRGPWYLSCSKALSVGENNRTAVVRLSNAYFKSLGLPSLVEDRMHGGVQG